VRFSTVAGGAGSIDTARDVRGFAVKFYTSEGNFDLVGNNIPVFFIQDAMKFPDLVHSVKMEADRGFPQAASAHDTFWDFVSLMPESMHMLTWVMSDRAIPRSFRTMEGFGVHTFRLIDAKGAARFVKFHWRPVNGSFSLVWDEAVKLGGADYDFHRRDLWEAIDSGNFPEYELAFQIFDEKFADTFDFDVLDATKIIPEELVPLQVVGKMTLNRNPDNFFAETEQVAFHPGHIVPGIDFSNDPLLQGRLFSYLDTQLIRLGGPNFHQIPINQPKCPFRNLQRDGHMQMMVPKGQVNYEPNSIAPEAPRECHSTGFASHPSPYPAAQNERVRARSESFGDHYSQARQFYLSQTAPEREHIAGAFAFELGKVSRPAIRARMLAHLNIIHQDLGGQVRKNEKGALVVKYGTFTPKAREDDDERSIPYLKGYTVFNVEQIENLPERFYRPAEEMQATTIPLLETVETFVRKTGAAVTYGGTMACFRPAVDDILMPDRARFASEVHLYSTLLHEISHYAVSRIMPHDRSSGWKLLYSAMRRFGIIRAILGTRAVRRWVDIVLDGLPAW